MKYTVAFIFSRSPSGQLKVLLIRKNRPEWQAGKLNGVGGKLEFTDMTPATGCVREVFEETGLFLVPYNGEHAIRFVPTARLTGDSYEIQFFAMDIPWEVFASARTTTDEQVEAHCVENLPPDVIPNLRWLIPLALNVLRHDHDGGFLVST